VGANVKTLFSTAFKQIIPATKYLQNLFKSPDEYVFSGEDVQIDIIRTDEEFAVNCALYKGGRGNAFDLFTDKEWTPPMYDEFAYITAPLLQKRMPGRTIYDMGTGYERDFAFLLLEYSRALANKIVRAKEIQARDALFYGQITLVNGDVIDFNFKADHIYALPSVWTNSTSNPFAHFATIGGRVRRDSGRAIMDAIFGETMIQEFLNNDIVKASADLEQIDRMALTSPIAQDEGATYHGTFSANDYKINAWTYPQYHKVPVGYGLPNEGTKQPYIPTDRVVVLPTDPDFRLYYGGVPTLQNLSPETANVLEMTQFPTMEAGRMVPYADLDKNKQAVKVGVRSRPLTIPVDVDSIGVLTRT